MLAFGLSYLPTLPAPHGLLVLDSETSAGALAAALNAVNILGLLVLWRAFVRSPAEPEAELTIQQFERTSSANVCMYARDFD